MGYDKLTDKQKRFVDEYLLDLNGTQAYLRAGYRVKDESVASVNASRLLVNANVQKALKDRMEERQKRTDISADYVLNSLKTVAERCMQGEPVMVYDKELGEYVETGEWKFDSSGANRSLELIGKHLKLFTEKIEQENSGEIKINFNIPRPRYNKDGGDE